MEFCVFDGKPILARIILIFICPCFFFFLQYFKNICFLNFIDVQLIYNVVLISDVYLSMFDIIIVVQYLCETDSLQWQLALLLKQESLPSSPFLQLGFRQIWYLSIVLDPGETLAVHLEMSHCHMLEDTKKPMTS